MFIKNERKHVITCSSFEDPLSHDKLVNVCFSFNNYYYLETSVPKWVNPVLNITEVNSLRLGGLPLNFSRYSNLFLGTCREKSRICTFNYISAIPPCLADLNYKLSKCTQYWIIKYFLTLKYLSIYWNIYVREHVGQSSISTKLF